MRCSASRMKGELHPTTIRTACEADFLAYGRGESSPENVYRNIIKRLFQSEIHRRRLRLHILRVSHLFSTVHNAKADKKNTARTTIYHSRPIPFFSIRRSLYEVSRLDVCTVVQAARILWQDKTCVEFTAAMPRKLRWALDSFGT